MKVAVERIASPVGRLTLACSGVELVTLAFEDHEARVLTALRSRLEDVVLAPGCVPRCVRDAIVAYFDGEIGALAPLLVRTGGTSFQRSVWQGLRSIPSGKTTSYSRLARAIGRPTATRAVGLANGANPIAIVLPCHRVIGEGGALVGYGGGLERKRWLLRHEGALADNEGLFSERRA